MKKEIETLYQDYYVEFGEFPPIMMTTDGENEEYLTAIKQAIEDGKPINDEKLNMIYDFDYDLVIDEPKQDQEPKGEHKMEDKDLTKIQNLLKTYGAEDNEIKNFMQDLTAEAKEIDTPMEEEKEDTYILNKDNIDKLKLTDEGKDLIMKAPEMAKEELEEAIKNYLEKYKD